MLKVLEDMAGALEVLLVLVAVALFGPEAEAVNNKPNFILFFVDDLDFMLNATHPAYMPFLNQHIANQGLLLRNNLVSTAGTLHLCLYTIWLLSAALHQGADVQRMHDCN